MTDTTPPTVLGADQWRGDMGAKWLGSIEQFESMIAPAGAALMAHAAFTPGEHVVDIGCGGGLTSIEIAANVGPEGSVLGLDISPDLVVEAQRRAAAAGCSNVRFAAGDAAAAIPDGAPFDRLFSRFGSMFFDDPYPAFVNLRRMVRPGGRIDLGVWAPARENAWMREPGEVIGQYLELPKPVPRVPGPCALDDPEYVRDLLGSAGFSDIAITPWTGDQLVGGAGASAQDAVDFTLQASSIGMMAADSAPEIRTRICDDLLALFARHATDRGIVMQAKIWLVTARA